MVYEYLFLLRKGYMVQSRRSERDENKSVESELDVGLVIGSHQIVCDDARCSIIVDHARIVTFSRMQYRALKLLLSGKGVSEENLIEAVYGKSATLMEHEALYQLVRKIRDKLRPIGLTVLPVEQSGYVLVAIPE